MNQLEQMASMAIFAKIVEMEIDWGLFAAPIYLERHPAITDPDQLSRHGGDDQHLTSISIKHFDATSCANITEIARIKSNECVD